jgi:aldehyde:ferredoxin oxidoreductase
VYGGPEYETLATLGSYCGVDDLPAICKANELCNAYGMDAISCGATIAWAMECFEKGKLTASQTDGIDLDFGNAAGMVEMVERIAKREGYGDVLAEGSYRAAQQLGQGTDALVVHARGQEWPAHEARVKPIMGMIYSVNPFGADHMSSGHDPGYVSAPVAPGLAQLGLDDPQPQRSLNAAKVHFARLTQQFRSVTDSLNVCQFVWGAAMGVYGPEQTVELVRHVTGWEMTLEELLRVGERRINMMRAFNAREGMNRTDDQLPPRAYEPLVGGPTDGWAIDPQELGDAQQEYYRQNGWDPATGNPTREKLEDLGLGWVADEIDV